METFLPSVKVTVALGTPVFLLGSSAQTEKPSRGPHCSASEGALRRNILWGVRSLHCGGRKNASPKLGQADEKAGVAESRSCSLQILRWKWMGWGWGRREVLQGIARSDLEFFPNALITPGTSISQVRELARKAMLKLTLYFVKIFIMPK